MMLYLLPVLFSLLYMVYSFNSSIFKEIQHKFLTVLHTYTRMIYLK